MIIDQSKAKSLVAAFGCHRPTGTLVSVSSFSAFSDCSPEESRRVLMAGVMDGSLKLVRSSGGNLVCQTIDREEQEYNALLLQASAISECNRIQRIADSM